MNADVLTLWATYGPYHVARVNALAQAFKGRITPVSFCESDATYAFFKESLPNQVVLFSGRFDDIKAAGAIWKSFRTVWSIRPSLVLACGYERPESFGALLAAKLLRVPTFLMFDNQADDSPRNSLKERIKSSYVKCFDGYVYAGPHNGEYLRRLRVSPGREVDGYDCVDNQRFESLAQLQRAAGATLHPRPYLLCIARLIAKKNLVRLISAYDAYRRSVDEPWDLVIVGDGPQREALQQQIDGLDLSAVSNGPSVLLAGLESDQRRIAHWYAFAKGLILASHENEQWGLVVNEAMATGLPVLVSRQTGCASSLVVDGENGRLFDGLDAQQITASIQWLHYNQSRLAEMGARSKQIADRFSPAEFARKVRELYQHVTQQKSR